MVTGLQQRPVEVQMHDGTWVPGFLQATHRVNGTWRGFVRYSERTSATHFRWFEEQQVRER